MSSLDRDNTITDWDSFDFPGLTAPHAITDISRFLRHLSASSMARRRNRKLREELVRVHIKGKQQRASILRSRVFKLLRL